MPRTGRGGARQGTPGKPYPNRADMASPKPVAVQTVPGQQYGLAGQQAEAQHAMPMAPPPAPAQGLPQPAPQPAPQMGPAPGEVTPLSAPTARPDEHVMTGAPMGPGPGPEALSVNQGGGFLADRLDQMAKVSGNADLQLLAERARQLGQ